MKIPAEGHIEVVKYSTRCSLCWERGIRPSYRDRKGTQRTFGPVVKNSYGSRCQSIHEKCLDCGHETDSEIDYDCLANVFSA